MTTTIERVTERDYIRHEVEAMFAAQDRGDKADVLLTSVTLQQVLYGIGIGAGDRGETCARIYLENGSYRLPDREREDPAASTAHLGGSREVASSGSTPVLYDGVIYVAHDRFVCSNVNCAGATALYTGRTVHGTLLEEIDGEDVVTWARITGGWLTCECGRLMARHTQGEGMRVQEVASEAECSLSGTNRQETNR